MTAYSVESGESANWTLQPPSTPSARMIASAALRSRWWTGVGQRLDGRDDDRVAGVDAERVDVLHRADGDARVVGVAHHLVLDLLPADEALLDHHLADRAGAQAGPDPLAVGRLGLDDAAAGPAERERRADDRRQADRRRAPRRPMRRAAPRRSRPRRSTLGAYGSPIRSSRSRNASRSSAIRIASSGVPEQPDAVALEDARLGQRDRQVQRRLPAQPGSRPSGAPAR